ncbi:PAAR domain-containing protein, partial [Salmonella enterica subsp. enterica serovar Infantis]|nr:PAAR domain-containing protein [Salmonella enterica subsp. enterica serovar Infantis]
ETDDGGSEPEQHAQSARKNLTSGNPDKKYSHQIKLQHGENNVSVQDIPYVFILNNNMSLSGKTNQDGETERIYTDTAQKVIALTGKLADSWLKRGKNFGSLKEIDNRKIELTTEENEPVKYVNWING